MQSVSSRIWTCVTVSISYNDNHYTTGTSIDGTRSGSTSPDQSGPGSDGNQGILHIPHSCRTGGSPSNSFVLYLEHLLVERSLTPLQRFSQCILQPNQLGYNQPGGKKLEWNTLHKDQLIGGFYSQPSYQSFRFDSFHYYFVFIQLFFLVGSTLGPSKKRFSKVDFWTQGHTLGIAAQDCSTTSPKRELWI